MEMNRLCLLLAAACLVSQPSFAADVPIGDSQYICRSESGAANTLLKRRADGSLQPAVFSTSLANERKRRKRALEQAKAVKAQMRHLGGKALSRARRRLLALRRRAAEAKSIIDGISGCRDGGAAGCQAIASVTILGADSAYANVAYSFNASAEPSTASGPISYTWSPEPTSGQGTALAAYAWSSAGTQTISVNAANCAGAAQDEQIVTVEAQSADLLLPQDFAYQGAFRLPGGDEPPQTFAYGGNAMPFNPSGAPGGTDAFPGSLFITGHDRQAWGMLPNGSQVAEISIPAPLASADLSALPSAEFIQTFRDVAAGHFAGLDEIPRIGMQYLNHPLTGALIHLGWGQHLQPAESWPPSHAWFSPDLSNPQMKGEWYIGTQDGYRVNGYLFEIPSAWADAHASGRCLAAGRYRDGGQGSMGPVIMAYRPWEADGSAPPSGTHLSESVLLLYENAYNTDQIVRSLNGYQHADEWEGGAWISTASGKSAVVFSGNKGTGAKYWYGYRRAGDPSSPCVDPESIGQFRACIAADGTDCPAADLGSCAHEGDKGWWSSSFKAQLLLYDQAQLAQVAAGTLEAWQPQPYAVLDIEDRLYLNPAGIEEGMIGAGVQRRYKIGDASFDRGSGLLYVLELFADQAKPVVHAWKVQ